MAFKFSDETKKTLSETFNAVKAKTWHGTKESYVISSTREFSKAFGECIAKAVSTTGSKVSFATSTDDELAHAACDVMKKKMGIS